MLHLLLLMATDKFGDLPGPSAPPTNPNNEAYSGSLIRIMWTAGDVLAQTRVKRDGVIIATLAPAVATYDTGFTSGTFVVLHERNLQLSAELQVYPIVPEA